MSVVQEKPMEICNKVILFRSINKLTNKQTSVKISCSDIFQF